MSRPSRYRLAALPLVAAVALLAGACGLDDSSSQTQDRECRAAEVGTTTRDEVHRALGSPTITEHETSAGRRVVADLWVDGGVGFAFDERTEVLVEKDC